MRTRFFSLLYLYAALTCTIAFAAKPTPAPKTSASATPAPTVSKPSKPVVDQTAQTIIYCYHRLVDKVRYLGAGITHFVDQAVIAVDDGLGGLVDYGLGGLGHSRRGRGRSGCFRSRCRFGGECDGAGKSRVKVKKRKESSAHNWR